MGKGFGIGGAHVNITGADDVLQKAIWNGTEFDDVVGNSKMLDQGSCRCCAIRARILFRGQFAGQEEPNLPPTQALLKMGKGSQQSFEIPVLVVVAHEDDA